MLNKKYATNLLTLSIMLLLLASCVQMTLKDAGKLTKGMSYEQVRAVLPVRERQTQLIRTSDKEVSIKIFHYIIHSGAQESNYFLAFKDDKLYFWGYLHEFNRASDSLANDIGNKLITVVKER